MLWADAGDPYAAVWCGNAGDRRHKAAVRYQNDDIRSTVSIVPFSRELIKIPISYLSSAAVVTSGVSAARCSGWAPC